MGSINAIVIIIYMFNTSPIASVTLRYKLQNPRMRIPGSDLLVLVDDDQLVKMHLQESRKLKARADFSCAVVEQVEEEDGDGDDNGNEY